MLNYNAPIDGAKSTIDNAPGNSSDQMNSYHWLRKSIITARKLQFFTPLARTENMPKNYGKTMKLYEYVPVLDDRNINDQGIDANGVTVANGNLYGSSKDIGTITAKLPTLQEGGGRVNRIGFTRIQREGSLVEFGEFFEFTKDSLMFDSDPELLSHLSRELVNSAVQISEAVLQRDILAAAGVTVFAGAATSNGTVTAEGATPSIVEHDDLVRLDQILTDNRTPMQTTVISGSLYTDTRTIPAARIMFVGSELVPMLKKMQDSFGNPAFIAVQHYTDAGTALNGEIGCIDAFRLIQVPEMLHWAGVGATVGTNPGYRAANVGNGNRYNVYPMVVVGEDSFATIGFQTDGKSAKLNVLTKMPGRETADRNDPYGKTGFSSIAWFYGFLAKRPERIGLIKTVAPI